MERSEVMAVDSNEEPEDDKPILDELFSESLITEDGTIIDLCISEDKDPEPSDKKQDGS
jgi:hypothetical protein